MKMTKLYRKQELPIQLEEAWQFFSKPENLSTLTPPDMQFKIQERTGNGSMFQGQIISYKIKILPFISVNWVTEITHVDDKMYFIDEQRFGPYAFWHHLHRFRKTEKGVAMEDEVCYKVPFGFLGTIAHQIFVKRMLHRIFNYRFYKLNELFNS